MAAENGETLVLDGGSWFSNNSLRFENMRLRRANARQVAAASRSAALIREADHRIKGSLQIVVSLLMAQAHRDVTGLSADALRSAAARVQSIAHIHDGLQQGAGKDEVDLGAILKSLCEQLQVIAGDPDRIAVVVCAPSLKTPVALAQPIMLAVNELVVNALRHAFPAGRGGVVTVTAERAGGALRIVVADDGVGLSPTPVEGPGFGTKLVRMMIDRMGGALEVSRDLGAKFTIVVPARTLSHL